MFVTQGPGARPADLLLRRLGALADLSELEERQVRAAAAGSGALVRAGRNLHTDRRQARHARFVVSGWACRRRILADGRRQIFSILLPGDAVDFLPNGPDPSEVDAVALTPVETLDVEHLRVAADEHPGLAHAFTALGEQQDRLLLDHVVRLGRMTALERLTHLLLELRERLAGVGLADERRMPLPLTQEVMADALGLSIVHVNRTLQQLRQGGLIELRSGVAALLDLDRLRAICSPFRPAQPVHFPSVAARRYDLGAAPPA